MAIQSYIGSVIFKGTDNFSAPSRRVVRSMKETGKTSRDMYNEMTRSFRLAASSYTLLLRSIGPLKSAFKLAEHAAGFESVLAQIKFVSSGTTEEMKAMEKVITSVAGKSEFTMIQTAKAAKSLAQRGFTLAQTMKFLAPTIDLASVSMGKLTPDRAAQAIHQMKIAFDLNGKQIRTVLDSLTVQAQKSSVSIEDMSIAMGNLISGAKALKVPADDLFIAFGLVKNAVGGVSKASRSLNTMLLRLTKNKIQKKMSDLGIVFKDQKGNFLQFLDIFNNMADVLEKKYPEGAARSAKVTELLGATASKSWAGLMEMRTKGIAIDKKHLEGLNFTISGYDSQGRAIIKGKEALEVYRLRQRALTGDVKRMTAATNGLGIGFIKLAKHIDKMGGPLAMYQRELKKTFGKQFSMLMSAIDVFKSKIGDLIKEEIKPFIKIVRKGFEEFNKRLEKMDPTLKQMITRFVLLSMVAVTLSVALVTVVGLFIGVKGMLIAIGAIGGTAFLPLLLILSGLALGIFVVYSALTSKEFVDSFKKNFDSSSVVRLTKSLGGLVDSIINAQINTLKFFYILQKNDLTGQEFSGNSLAKVLNVIIWLFTKATLAITGLIDAYNLFISRFSKSSKLKILGTGLRMFGKEDRANMVDKQRNANLQKGNLDSQISSSPLKYRGVVGHEVFMKQALGMSENNLQLLLENILKAMKEQKVILDVKMSTDLPLLIAKLNGTKKKEDIKSFK